VIQKAQIGRGFRGVLTYVFDESAERGHARARIVDTNMAGETPRELAAEFGLFRRLNPDLTRAVYHCSLRLPEDEALTAAQWGAFSRDYLAAMGFDAVPYVVVQHAADHVHIVASRVQFHGRTVPDGNDRWRSNRVVTGLEERYGLSHARDPERTREPRPQLSRDEIARAERRGELPPKLVLAARIDEAVARSDGTREGFDQALAALGVTAHWNIASTGQVHGASYAVRDEAGETQGVFKGSQLGKEYGWGRLAARLDARREEQEHGRSDDAGTRENGRLATAGPRDAARTGHDTDSGTPASRSEAPRAEAGRADGHVRAERQSIGAGGRADADHQGDRAAPSDSGRRDGDGDPLHAGAGRVSDRTEAGTERADERVVQSRRAGAAGGGRDATVGAGDSAAPAEDGAEREAGTAGGGGGRGGDGPRRRADRGSADRDRAAASLDRTTEAVQRQLAAMGCDRYAIGVRDPARGMLTRTGSADEIVAGIGWLKAMNAQGNDISVRPAGSSGVILVDDLRAEALKELARDGLTPAAVTETSPDTYQAWVRVSDGPLLPDIATEAAREVAARYGGDPKSADWRQYGRLAGFTNQQPEHTRADGQQPDVRLAAARGGEAPDGAKEVLARAQECFEGRLQVPISEPSLPPRREDNGERARSFLGEEYRERAARLSARYPDADLSRVDWMVTKDLARACPTADAGALTEAMRAGSPRLAERKGTQVEDYLARTVGKVLATPDVMAARRETRARDDGRGDR